MNTQPLVTATLIGTILQIGMVLAGHWIPAVQGAFMFGGLGLSCIAGAIYELRARGSWGGAAVGGVIAGGVSALAGIAVSWLLGDVPATLLLLGTSGSAVTGLLGGVAARLLRPKAATGGVAGNL
ncbi:MAG TPA: hypothetical protein VGE92_04220 [Steroidobacteraceae bacterium]